MQPKTYLRTPTDEEIINGLREALKFYADSENWNYQELKVKDMNTDDCSGHYRKAGQRARNALGRFNKTTEWAVPLVVDENFLG